MERGLVWTCREVGWNIRTEYSISMVMQRRPGKIPGQGRFTTILVVLTNAGVIMCHLEHLCHQIHDEFPNHCQNMSYFRGREIN